MVALPSPYRLRLFVTGSTAASLRAIRNLKQLCDRLTGRRCDLQVIDVYQQPELVREERILVFPTLVKYSPGERVVILGDLADQGRVLRSLTTSRKP